MPGLVATLGLNASQYEAKYQDIVARTASGQKQMASAAEVSAARQIKAIDDQLAAAQAGSEAYVLLEREKALAVENFTYTVERETRKQIAAEAAANAAATKEAEKRERLRIRGQAQAAAIAKAEEAEIAKAAEAAEAAAEAERAAAVEVAGGISVLTAAQTEYIGVDVAAMEAENAKIAATEAATLAQTEYLGATIATTEAEEVQNVASKSLSRGLAQLLVILKDLVRGQWSRALSTFLTMLQDSGVAVEVLAAGVGGLALAAGGIYLIANAFTEARNAIRSAADSLRLYTEALQSNLRMTEDAARRNREFAEWLDRLHNSGRDDSFSTKAERDIKSLREKLEADIKVMKSQGASPEKILEAKKTERWEEQGVWRRALKDAEAKQKKTEAAAIRANATAGPVGDLARKGEADAKTAVEIATSKLAAAKAALDRLKSPSSLGDIWAGLGAGTVPGVGTMNKYTPVHTAEGNTTVDEAQKRYDAAIKALAAYGPAVAASEEQIKKAQEEAKKAEDDLERVKQKKADADEEAKRVAAEDAENQKQQKESGILTANQKIGAFISPGTVSLIDVTRGIHQSVKETNKKLDKIDDHLKGNQGNARGGRF